MDSIQLKLPFPPEIEWRDIPGYVGIYQVSNTGLVKRVKSCKSTWDGRVLSGTVTPAGYIAILMSGKYPRENWYVHRLVMLAFVGFSDLVVNHKNGIKSDNRLENLEYVTQLENVRHSIDVLGIQPLSQKGVKHHYARLNEEKVREIRRIYTTGEMRQSEIGRLYGVTANTIRYIVRHRRWKHVE